MKYLLDTNTCIGWLRLNQPNLVKRIESERPADLVICSVVVGELLYGAERAATGHRAKNRQRVDELRQQMISLPFDDSAAEEYGKVRAQLMSAGQSIGPNDCGNCIVPSPGSCHSQCCRIQPCARFNR